MISMEKPGLQTWGAGEMKKRLPTVKCLGKKPESRKIGRGPRETYGRGVSTEELEAL
jgi:hypothetical protein